MKDARTSSDAVPVKAALAMMLPGLSDEVRLPLAALEPKSRERLRATLMAAGLLG